MMAQVLFSDIFFDKDPHLNAVELALSEPKWIIQQLWKSKIDWDELLPSDRSTNTDTKLHVFADASKIAYGVACYIRFKVNNRPKCSFIMSKCKIAPVNKSQNLFHNLNYKLP